MPSRPLARVRPRLLAVLGVAAFAVVGCSAPPEPAVTFYADGDTVRTEPLIHCDALVRQCEQGGEPARLAVRPGRPVQISVPADVAEAPWVVNVQYLDAAGEPRPVRQEFFSPGTQHAHTVTAGPGDQLLVVEVQQLGAAFAGDEEGNPIVDEEGNPQLVARAIWSLQVEPA
ncbi:DUF2771 family protein [Amycolatopsis arida]|nr:DUF2771 family protein [Amycolatopsis arida]